MSLHVLVVFFSPAPQGKRDKSFMNKGRFVWSASDGLFKKIVDAADEGKWVRKCNEALARLKNQCALEGQPQPRTQALLPTPGAAAKTLVGAVT